MRSTSHGKNNDSLVGPRISEEQLQHELELSRGTGRLRNLARRLAISVAGAAALENHLIRVREIGVVENIKRFRPEL